MATSRSGASNGSPNGAGTPSSAHAQPGSYTRPFTLQEALPYTPFSSISPFDPNIIPSPSIGTPHPSITDDVSRQYFDALNQEAISQGVTSKRLQQSLRQIQHLIGQQGETTEYKFITGPKASASDQSQLISPPSADLKPFSRMVFNQASVSFRYPSPITPGGTPLNTDMKAHNENSSRPLTTTNNMAASKQAPYAASQTPGTGVKKESPSASKASQMANTQAFSKNASRIEIRLPTKKQLEQDTIAQASSPSHGTPKPTNVSSPQQVVMTPIAASTKDIARTNGISPPQDPSDNQIASVGHDSTARVPDLPPTASQSAASAARIAIELPGRESFNKGEFMLIADEPDEPTNVSSRKRKREGLDQDELYGDSLDLRQRADAAFQDLRRTLRSIFEAEESAMHHKAGNDVIVLTTDGEAVLTAGAQQRVQSLLSKTMSLNCFESVPLEDLLHVLRLSEPAVRYAEGLDIRIDSSWAEEDVQQWLRQFPDLEMGLKAARTSFRMMCGGREDKQLSSENMIQHSLDLFKHVMDGIIIPLAELRQSSSSDLFKFMASNKKKISTLLTDCQKLFSLMSEAIAKIDTSDTVSNTLEFAATRLIFLENAHSEKESVIETQKFDSLRLVAMDMLSQIFLANPSQRQGIFDEILTSLEKLPVTKQRARQFKLMDGTSIQPVSALIMRLVQTSAGKVKDRTRHGASNIPGSTETIEGEEAVVLSTGIHNFTIRNEDHGAQQHMTAIQELQTLVGPLMDMARRNASYVVQFIVNRALKSTKTGDTPYRNLLDLFVDDFTSCLSNPDWPAAELLLEVLMAMMVNLVEGERTAAPSKNMALELLGSMGAAISTLRGHVRKTANNPDASDTDELGEFLSSLALAALELESRPEHMVSWSGPYRVTLEYLEGRFSEDPHLTSAIYFLATKWAKRIGRGYDSFDDDVDSRDQEFGRLAYRLREISADRRWLTNEYTFKTVSDAQARFAYAITLLRSPLCEQFNGIVNILLSSMASDQATVRSKSLKSVNQVIETDPSILDGESVVVRLIVECMNDSSTQVRDSALGLIGKCIALRPALEEKMLATVLGRFTDMGPGVRKRAMKLAKDIYLRNSNKSARSAVASNLLMRVQDPEESVRDLARQMVEEIWFTPFHNNERSAVSQTSLAQHVALMVQTVKHGSIATVLDKVLQTVLAAESKASQANYEVCRMLVATMFDFVDNQDSDDPALPTGRDALQVLVIFSKAEARLFTFEQIRLLKPYIENIQSSEDGLISRAVSMIYRRVLPQLSSTHSPFLVDIRKELLPAVGKVPRNLLDDIVACLWIISTLLENSEHLARLLLSSLSGLQKMRAMTTKQPLQDLVVKRFTQYSWIVGMIGKHCDLDSHHEFFKQAFPRWSGTSVAKLIVDVMMPFAAPEQPLEIRKAALDCAGLVCQASPRNYVLANVYTTFAKVFESHAPVLESMILKSFKEFLFNEERRSEKALEGDEGLEAKGTKRELTVMGGTTYDDVASATTQRFLGQITRIATSTLDDHAFLAVELLASINRQGLVHPKETGVTFMTLETSPHPKISELAYLQHKSLHEKHETVVEREYVKALQSIFAYHRDVVKDAHGATTNPFTSKLHSLMEVLKISKSKNRQKFLEKMCTQINFDPSKLDVSEGMPEHVQYARFLIENISFLEFVTIGEVQTTVTALEKIFTSTGASVAQTIESEVMQVRMDLMDGSTVDGNSMNVAPPAPPVNPVRLRQLAAASVILLSLWETRTYLRRLYGMGTARFGKGQAKDLARAPVKTQGMTGDKLWEDVDRFISLMGSREDMTAACNSFVELMNVDKEFTIANEDDEMDDDPATPDNDEDDGDDQAGQGRGRKRKAAGTPSSKDKKKARASSQPRKRGRPRKNPVEPEPQDADGEFEEDVWF